jgi:hypothetical protein
MRRNRMLRGLKIAVIAVPMAVLVAALVCLVLMALWNSLTPDLFGWKPITFWQAAGLLILSRILLGGRFGGPGRHWRHRMRERWEHMTPEEREKFRAAMRARCGHGPWEPPPATPPAATPPPASSAI